MKKIMFAVLVISAPFATGCKKTGGSGEAMAKMTEYRDRMCACADSACAQKVSDEMTKWGQDQARTNKEPAKMSDEDTKKFSQIGSDMGTCMQKAMGAANNGSAAMGSAMGADTTGNAGMTGSAGTTGTTGTGDMAGSAAMGGTAGTAGTPGTPGTAGTNGTDGTNGTAGTTGTAGTNGSAMSGGTAGGTTGGAGSAR